MAGADDSKENHCISHDFVTEDKDYCGFPWQLRGSKDNDGWLSIDFFSYKDDVSNVWFCDVSVEFSIINQNEGGENRKIGSVEKHRFTPENADFSVKEVLIEPNIFDSESGLIKDDTIIVEACITLHSKAGQRFRNKIEYDMFSPSQKSDGILIVEGRKLYVSKQLLSIHSPFFDRIFYGKFKESEQLETEINDVELDEFTVLLKMMYPTGEPFRGDNVEYILKLADRFEMLKIMDDAEQYLLYTMDEKSAASSKSLSIHKKLRLADQYNLHVLQHHLLCDYNTPDLIRELKKSSDYAYLKEETKDFLFQQYIDFTSTLH